ncbi:MAG: hypothetical protein ACRCYX_11915 [Dermatophilaceae bacterium]
MVLAARRCLRGGLRFGSSHLLVVTLPRHDGGKGAGGTNSNRGNRAAQRTEERTRTVALAGIE